MACFAFMSLSLLLIHCALKFQSVSLHLAGEYLVEYSGVESNSFFSSMPRKWLCQ